MKFKLKICFCRLHCHEETIHKIAIQVIVTEVKQPLKHIQNGNKKQRSFKYYSYSFNIKFTLVLFRISNLKMLYLIKGNYITNNNVKFFFQFIFIPWAKMRGMNLFCSPTFFNILIWKHKFLALQLRFENQT